MILNADYFKTKWLTGTLYNRSKLVYVLLNEGDMVPEFYSCLKFIVQANLHVVFAQNIFVTPKICLHNMLHNIFHLSHSTDI